MLSLATSRAANANTSRSIQVREADSSSLDRWANSVNQADGLSIFHQRAALEVLAEHSGAGLHCLVGYNGQEPVGLLPVFELSRGPFTTAFSPPPMLGVPRLGPVLTMPAGLKQRKREQYNREFVGSALEWLDRELRAKYVYITSTADYSDIRPFKWADFQVTPRFTYRVDVNGDRDDLMGRFNRDLRSNIRRTDPSEYEIYEGGHDVIEFIVHHIRERYQAYGKQFDLTAGYVKALYDQLPDGQVRPYAAEVDGELVSGVIALEFGDTCYYWQGGGKPDVRLPINDVLHWKIITDSRERGVEVYDLVGGNNPRICKYKSKFNPSVAPYYEMRRGTPLMNLAASVYRRVR